LMYWFIFLKRLSLINDLAAFISDSRSLLTADLLGSVFLFIKLI